jgi:hypothetical protein
MYQSLVQYCDLSHSGLLTSDLGLTYGNVIEGGNSEIRYNLLHDNDDDHLDMGLYYDHGTQNIISHHNIVWGVGYSAFHINHYGAYHLAYNNTFISDTHGFRSNWGNQYAPDLLECRFVNNLLSGTAETTAGNYYWSNNIDGYESFDAEYPMQVFAGGVGRGLYIRNITASPDGVAGIGAIEHMDMRFTAGHNFDHPPETDFTRSRPLHRNMLHNTAFEHEDHLRPWKLKGGGVQVKEFEHKNHTQPDTARCRMGNYSVQLVQEGSELLQQVQDLVPGGTYGFTGHLRVDRGEAAVLGVRLPDGSVFTSPRVTYGSPGWRRVWVHFTLPGNASSAEVFVQRLTGGQGEIFVDDFGLVLR